jgi:small subunit ribosomal protein S6
VREYELNIIIQPEISEEGSATILSHLYELLEAGSSIRLLCDDLGKRKLAYEVNRFQKGHYYLLSFLDPGPVVAELERVLRLEESVLRFLTVKVNDDVTDIEGRVAEAKEREEELAKRAAEKATREAEEAKSRAEAEALASERAAAAAVAAEAKAKEEAEASETAGEAAGAEPESAAAETPTEDAPVVPAEETVADPAASADDVAAPAKPEAEADGSEEKQS